MSFLKPGHVLPSFHPPHYTLADPPGAGASKPPRPGSQVCSAPHHSRLDEGCFSGAARCQSAGPSTFALSTAQTIPLNTHSKSTRSMTHCTMSTHHGPGSMFHHDTRRHMHTARFIKHHDSISVATVNHMFQARQVSSHQQSSHEAHEAHSGSQSKAEEHVSPK